MHLVGLKEKHCPSGTLREDKNSISKIRTPGSRLLHVCHRTGRKKNKKPKKTSVSLKRGKTYFEEILCVLS